MCAFLLHANVQHYFNPIVSLVLRLKFPRLEARNLKAALGIWPAMAPYG
jgi:hypothetical protein